MDPSPDPARHPSPEVDDDSRRERQQEHRHDIKPLLEELRIMIRRSEYSQRQVEEMAGFSRGYLSQLLAQNLDLKVWHLLAILSIFDHHPSEFFARLWPDAPDGDALRRFAQGSEPLEEDITASVERLYRVGVDSLGHLRRRLERYDEAMDELEAQGLVRPVKTE